MQITKYKPIEFDDKWNLLLNDVPESDIDGDLDPSEVKILTARDVNIFDSKLVDKCNRDFCTFFGCTII